MVHFVGPYLAMFLNPLFILIIYIPFFYVQLLERARAAVYVLFCRALCTFQFLNSRYLSQLDVFPIQGIFLIQKLF